MYKLGLLPFVKKLHIYEDRYSDVNRIFPGILHRTFLHQYSAMTNLQELAIDNLKIRKFIPKIRRCFGHFSPTLRSLALREPKGSFRQIIYFIGFFQRLDDFKLLFKTGTSMRRSQEELIDNSTPAPRFTPPLRGRLTMRYSREVELVKLMINLFGGLRFQSMDLYCVDGIRLLLDACAGTLETLRLFQSGEQLPLRGIQSSNDHIGCFDWGFDLSRNRSLRILEVPVSSIAYDEPGYLTDVLSTITSPVFSKVVFIYRDYDFYDLPSGVRGNPTPYYRHFLALREMSKVRAFQAVLCADVWDRVVVNAVQELEQAVAKERVKMGFDVSLSEPLVISRLRGSSPMCSEEGGGDP